MLVRTGRPDRASNVSGVTNFCASAVMATVTPAPSWTSLETTSATLYAAIPPQTATIDLAALEDRLHRGGRRGGEVGDGHGRHCTPSDRTWGLETHAGV